MNLDKVRDLVASVAPLVGTALGGPLGGVAGQFVQRALGAETAEQAVALLQTGDPEIILKMKQADLDFQKFMEDAGVRREQLVVEDRKDARGLAKALGTIGPQMLITGALTAIVTWITYELFLEAPPKGSENVLFMIVGQVIGAWGSAVGFFVGTTQSSAVKNATVQQLAAKG